MALGRRAQPPIPDMAYLNADLLVGASLDAHRQALSQITHLFFSAYKQEADVAVEATVNTNMLRNMLDALQAAGAPLERVILFEGGKAYGALVGPYRTPALESDPRIMTPLPSAVRTSVWRRSITSSRYRAGSSPSGMKKEKIRR